MRKNPDAILEIVSRDPAQSVRFPCADV